jgi:hypothetical protein
MKTLEELTQLRDELKAAYETVVNNPQTGYDNATLDYALKCYKDAEKAMQYKALDELTKESEDLGITE